MSYYVEKISKYLKDKGISQAELCDKIGMKRPAFSNLINGKSKMRIDTYLKICDALGVSIDEFLDTHSA